jgi:hypothetical protein
VRPARALSFLLLGPAAWALDLVGSYVLVPSLKERHSAGWLLLLTGITLAMASLGVGLAWRTRASQRESGAGGEFIATFGAVLNAYFIVVIIATAFPKVLLGPGD